MTYYGATLAEKDRIRRAPNSDRMSIFRKESTAGGKSAFEIPETSLLPHHYEVTAFVTAPPESVFAYADDPARLSSHMSQSSWMMGGGRMQTEMDAARGQQVGSRIRLSGRAFGVRLYLEETVTERAPPQRKVWRAVGSPRLLIIGHYRMGFEITAQQVR